MNTSHDLAITEMVLHRLKFACHELVGTSIIDSLRLNQEATNAWADDMAGHLLYQLSGEVLAEKHLPKVERVIVPVTFDAPANWFQHLKQTGYRWHRLAWLARRWPAGQITTTKRITVTVDISRYHSYPQANIALQQRFGKPVPVLITSSRSFVEGGGRVDDTMPPFVGREGKGREGPQW